MTRGQPCPLRPWRAAQTLAVRRGRDTLPFDGHCPGLWRPPVRRGEVTALMVAGTPGFIQLTGLPGALAAAPPTCELGAGRVQLMLLARGQAGCPALPRSWFRSSVGPDTGRLWSNRGSAFSSALILCSAQAQPSSDSDTQTRPWLDLHWWIFVSLLLALCPVRAGPCSLGPRGWFRGVWGHP